MTADALRPTYEDLVAENTALRERVAEVEQRNAHLQARLDEREAALKTALGQLEAARRAGQRLAGKAGPTSQVLLPRLRQEPLVKGDETGWKVAGRNAWLWVFTSVGLTVSTIDPRRSHEVAERILGKDFAGILNCDCFLAYDALPYRQHKCTGHLLWRCAEVQGEKTGVAAELTLRERRERLGAER